MLAIRTRIVINFCANASGAWSPLLRLRDSAGGLRVFAAVEEEVAGRAGVRESYLFADTIVRQTVQRCVQAWHGSSDVGLSWKCLWLFSRTRLGLLHVRVLRRAPRSADPLHTSLFPRRETINFISFSCCTFPALTRLMGPWRFVQFMLLFCFSYFGCYMPAAIRQLDSGDT